MKMLNKEERRKRLEKTAEEVNWEKRHPGNEEMKEIKSEYGQGKYLEVAREGRTLRMKDMGGAGGEVGKERWWIRKYMMNNLMTRDFWNRHPRKEGEK